MENLKPRQDSFCVHYTTIGSETYSNGTKAALAAGYSKKSAHVTATKLLKQEAIRSRIVELQAENMRRNMITIDKVVTLYFNSDRPGPRWVFDIWVSTRETINSDWGSPVALESPINSHLDEGDPVISDDGLVLIFGRDHDTRNGKLWMATRRTKEDPWDEPQMLGSMVNILKSNYGPDISSDGRWLIWCSSEHGDYEDFDIWQAPIIPIVDFNDEGIVDSTDMVIMIDHWGTDNSLCDIGPMPWGDGIVDVQDLIVLAEHLFEEVPPVE